MSSSFLCKFNASPTSHSFLTRQRPTTWNRLAANKMLAGVLYNWTPSVTLWPNAFAYSDLTDSNVKFTTSMHSSNATNLELRLMDMTFLLSILCISLFDPMPVLINSWAVVSSAFRKCRWHWRVAFSSFSIFTSLPPSNSFIILCLSNAGAHFLNLGNRPCMAFQHSWDAS